MASLFEDFDSWDADDASMVHDDYVVDGDFLIGAERCMGARGFVAEENRDYWNGAGAVYQRPKKARRGPVDSTDDPVMSLVQRVYDEFYGTCICTLAHFMRPSKRQVWLVEPRNVMELSRVVRQFTDRENHGHVARLGYFLTLVRPADYLPSDFDPNGVAAKSFRGYCTKTQFVLVFSVPFTKQQIRTRKLPRGARRRLTLEITTPPLKHHWDQEIHRFLPKTTRTDIENVVQACRGLPLHMYEENPFSSMPPPLFHRIFGYLVTPAGKRGRCLLQSGAD
jgi:hypothetical protein